MTSTINITANRKRALEIYLKQSVANLANIARDLRLPIEDIRAWHTEDAWLETRRKKLASEKKKLVTKVGKPQDMALSALRVAQKGLTESEKQLQRANSPAEIQTCSRMCRDFVEMGRQAYQDLGLLRK